MNIRDITIIEQEIRSEGGRALATPTRRVAACATFQNPWAGRALDDHEPAVALSVEIGRILVERALARLGDYQPIAYAKGVIVGTYGDLETGAAMIHVRLGLPMREAIKRGYALIPGNAKVAGPGTTLDLAFGGIDDGWHYDAMDTMTVGLPGSPRPDEILLAVAYAGPRPGARLVGNPPDRVRTLVDRLKGTS